MYWRNVVIVAKEEIKGEARRSKGLCSRPKIKRPPVKCKGQKAGQKARLRGAVPHINYRSLRVKLLI